MDFDQESNTRRELRVLVFPGTRLLFRPTGVVCLALAESLAIPPAA